LQLRVDIKHTQGNFHLDCQIDSRNSCMGIFGRSGSGKSTLFRAIAGLLKPDSGTIRFNHRTLFDSENKVFIPPQERGIGMVFQDARLFPHWSVEKNLRAGEISSDRVRTRPFTYDEIVSLLNIKGLTNRPVQDLSGGEMQRIAIGRALLSNPQLLLMDEPLTGLDAHLKSSILPFFSRIHSELKIPVILISHDLSEILSLTDNIALMKQGEITDHNTLINLVENPHSLKVFKGSELTNIFAGKVIRHQRDHGITVLELNQEHHLKIELCDHIAVGSTIKVGITANQVALAETRIENISMRNQLPATVQKVIYSEGRSLCSLECCGTRVFAEITPETQSEMRIQEGSNLWILFKSVSVTW